MKKHDQGRDRREVLRLIAGAGLVPIFGCGENNSTASITTNPANPTLPVPTTGGCAAIPEETGGPYPGDGSNGPNALATSGVVRADIRSSFGALSGKAEGIPLAIQLTLVDTNAGCAPLVGYAFYLWHCDRAGQYSLYGLPNQNYLRGVQGTDANGVATFSSIFPACYAGRWPHIHVEVYPSIAAAVASSNKRKTTQLALPADVCNAVYATNGYEQSIVNFSQVSLTSDMVFADGVTQELATVVGTVTDGYLATLGVGIAVQAA